jgi:hypothetical protein
MHNEARHCAQFEASVKIDANMACRSAMAIALFLWVRAKSDK